MSPDDGVVTVLRDASAWVQAESLRLRLASHDAQTEATRLRAIARHERAEARAERESGARRRLLRSEAPVLSPLMTSWQEFEAAEPEFAGRVRTLFDAGRHKTIATLRADGSPRISGIECEFVDGELQFGSMPQSRKLADLKRDPRFALHGPTVHPVPGEEAKWPGEAKIAGRAIAKGAITGDGPEGESFVADIHEVAFTHLNEAATRLVVEWWTPTGGLRRIERD